MTDARIWQSAEVSRGFLEGTRAAIPLAQQQIDVMLRLLRAGRPVERFLDLGCGDGVLAAAVLSQYPQAQAVCLDFSPEMVAAARRRLPQAEVQSVDYGPTSWTQAVAPHAPFDAIVSGFSIHHQPDERKRSLYGELLELLAPGGWLLNLEHVSSASAHVEALHDELFIDCLHAARPSEARDAIATAYHNRADKAANILAPLETQLAWLRELGFADVDCYFKIFELALFGGRKR
ncbi:MAG: class I SAM-dependent methyltransferase [Acidobacteria bacterium]|nr:class I SAM-dependent methyltransferase [Acidobacteriota bacterium]